MVSEEDLQWGKVCNGFSVPLQIFRGEVCNGGKVCNLIPSLYKLNISEWDDKPQATEQPTDRSYSTF